MRNEALPKSTRGSTNYCETPKNDCNMVSRQGRTKKLCKTGKVNLSPGIVLTTHVSCEVHVADIQCLDGSGRKEREQGINQSATFA